jgi:hypothetical protein
MLKILLGAGLLALACLPARAECVSRSDVESWLAANAPAAKRRVLAGAEAQAFFAAYNAQPPFTRVAGDEILIAELPGDRGSVRLALFARGCMAGGGRMPAAAVRKLLGAIERSGA